MGSVGQGEARLHVAYIQHHPGEPDQQGHDARNRSHGSGFAEEDFQKAD